MPGMAMPPLVTFYPLEVSPWICQGIFTPVVRISTSLAVALMCSHVIDLSRLGSTSVLLDPNAGWILPLHLTLCPIQGHGA